MRLTKREITEFDEIVDVLRRCNVVRLGIAGEESPYVVPLSFGCEVENGKVAVYIHGSGKGLKTELLEKNNRVCIEADIFHRYEQLRHGITCRYESVIGFGTAELESDARHGLELIDEHCGYKYFPVENCLSLGTDALKVYKITLDSITGKRNL